MKLPHLGTPLTDEQLEFLRILAKSCRRSILQMVTKAQSGHPGGSCSSIDYLTLIYAMRVCQTNEPVIVSHGHISPAVYSILAELGVIPKDRVLETFRSPEDIYEGHVNRKIKGIHYGTGPLGIGGSVAAGFAVGDKIMGRDETIFLMMGDGEQQEGQVYEMINFAVKHGLGNLTNFIDYNEVQLTDSLEAIMPIQIAEHYKAAGWHVVEADGHDFQDMWRAIAECAHVKDKPSMILGKTIMGKGIDFMEASGRMKKADWHGKAPEEDRAEHALKLLELSPEEEKILSEGLAALPHEIWTPEEPKMDLKMPVDSGTHITYAADVKTDCRSAYGAALLDLAKLNPNVVALTADLADSVKTSVLQKVYPERHIECGIAEQHMISTAGGLSIRGMVPFASTFGAFMSSRAKDQARVNDINETNVKMVATHCGLSVGEDGPTHQVIDDISSFSGFFHTHILEPCDPNQTDHIIRFVAGYYGNFYVRMGRAKTPVLTKEDGTPFFGVDYKFEMGKADLLREGKRATVVAAGAMVPYALKAIEELGGDMDLLVVSSFLPFDKESILASAKKTGFVLTVHDHNIETGLARFVKEALFEGGIQPKFTAIGVKHYQLSGTADALYTKAGMDIAAIKKELEKNL